MKVGRVGKKKSIFFELEYWKFLPVRHCLDVMHIEKNVFESLIGTLLNIPGKTKDGVKTRLDLVEMGIRLGLKPNLEGSKKERLPLASWNLTLAEKKSMCGSFFGMKVPEDYSSNISSLVSMDDLKLSNYKSHDCHTIMQQLLGIAIRGVLEKPVRIVVIRYAFFSMKSAARLLMSQGCRKFRMILLKPCVSWKSTFRHHFSL